jgi:8-oxo-dGTP pyrophosphatase MutT (NUDIX family)
MTPIRTSAKAIIVRDNRLLVIHLWDEERGDRYILPGGGQHHSETLLEALRRECLEEIGVAVEVHELLFIREYIGQRGEFAAFDAGVHQVECMFRCTLLGDTEPAPGHEPDTRQVGIAWLPLARLHDYRLFPAALRNCAEHFSGRSDAPVYLGDVN